MVGFMRALKVKTPADGMPSKSKWKGAWPGSAKDGELQDAEVKDKTVAFDHKLPPK